MTAVSGLHFMLWSWKELSSRTAKSSGCISGTLSSSGAPMLPPRKTFVAGLLEQRCDYSGSGGLAVRARYGYRVAGADREESLHFRGQAVAGVHRGLELLGEWVKAGRSENNVLVKVFEICFAEAEFCALVAQELSVLKFALGALVADGDVEPPFEQKAL